MKYYRFDYIQARNKRIRRMQQKTLLLQRVHSIGPYIRFRWYTPHEYWVGVRHNFQCDWWELNLFFGFFMYAIKSELFWRIKNR